MCKSVFTSLAALASIALLLQCTKLNSQIDKNLKEQVGLVNWPQVLQNTQNQSPAILIKTSDSASYQLAIQKVSVDIKTLANIATTTIELVFYNDLDRILEGELVFPLPEGCTVSRFAMDVNEHLREAVVVEKEKGRVAFEATIRKKIDPGLLELTKGNNFRSRVYPIPAKGTKRIVIAFQQELKRIDNNFVYVLPLTFEDKLQEFSAKATVFRSHSLPLVYSESLKNFSFQANNYNYSAQVVLQNQAVISTLAFAIPQTETQHVLVEQDAEGGNTFLINLKTDNLPKNKNLPQKLSVLWDVSTSAAQGDLDKQTALLEAYLNFLKTIEVEIISFSNDIHDKKTFFITNGVTQNINSYLSKLVYDGATQPGIIDFNTLQGDEIWLFSDGIGNFGKQEFGLSTKPVFSVCASNQADFSTLKSIAYQSNGAFINLNETSVEAALKTVSVQSFSFLGIENNYNISHVYPSVSTPIGESFSIAGKMDVDETEITLLFGYGNEVTKRQKVFLSAHNNGINANMLKRIWAQKKLDDLSLNYDKNILEITELGKAFNLVTKNTSLIILDRVEDYLAHEIEPPLELKESYETLKQQQEANLKETETTHLEEVLAQFELYKVWYDKEHKAEKPKLRSGRGNNGALMGTFADSSTIIEDDAWEERGDLSENEEEPVMSYANSNLIREGYVGADKKSEDSSNGNTVISLEAWNPDAPYLDVIKANTGNAEAYKSYLVLKKDNQENPSFYLDVADYFFEKKEAKLGLRILSNIAEIQFENASLIRILAHRLEQLKYYDLAVFSYENVLQMRAEEPQSYRDLGLAYALAGKNQKAIESLYEVVKRPWDSRFPAIGAFVAFEINAILQENNDNFDLNFMDQRFIKEMPCDIRVVLNWDTDNCDMDLWVTDPNGEKCFYSHRETATGGYMSNDFTGGYGPEQFIIKNALKGAYKVEVNYYGTRSQNLLTATTIQVQLITNYGRNNASINDVTRRLGTEKEVLKIGSFQMP